ncbi:Citrate transporter [Nocardioides alpinus]|uniref:Citrate transporter n=1 Tax=Nocardioides alpinus TaxID=748909 RepID=A0A1I1BA94_9ACTN|nr:SLC13 family permease [Nocardioides alpinus]PKH40513.1 SLC13 family permease [Nocardioides alpinus]SFB47274.1 Citrate transporter [Nocardioides alpinus]
MDDATTALVVLAVVVALFIWNKLPVGTVALLAALGLWATGLVTTEEAVGGFGEPVVVFIATLFVVSEAIDSTGVTTWAGQKLLERAGTGATQVLVAVCLLSAVLTSLITLNGAVAALLPLVVLISYRVGLSPSQLLMPVAFAGSAGGMLMLMSSPVNVIISEAAKGAGEGPFPFFSFALVGIPLLVGTVGLCVVLGPRLLPRRTPAHAAPDLGALAETLEGQYLITDGFYRLRVRSRSDLIGQGPAHTLGKDSGVRVVAAESRDGRSVVGAVSDDDTLVVTGPHQDITQFALDHGLAVSMVGSRDGQDLMNREAGVAEVVVPPRSRLVGETVHRGMKRENALIILAVQRLGTDRGDGPIELAEGDAILLHGRWSALDQLNRDRDVLLVDSPDLVRRQTVPWGAKATRAVVVLAALVAMLGSGQVPPAIAGMAAAVSLVLFRVVSVAQAYRSVSWQTVVLVGALIPLSTAIQTSGAADRVASLLIDAVGSGRPILLLAALFVLTAVLGQVVSNTATVLVVVPIAMAAADATGTSAKPLLMAVAIAGCAALLTPISTPGNMMIMSPGGYRFDDYWKLGLPVMIWWFLVALVVVPLVWPL